MRNQITQYLNQFDLDVRRTNDARFSDQKCTPDVVCFIADCINNLPDPTASFVVNDIWDSRYFIKNAVAIFGKPRPTNRSANHEYDKFIQQPLRLLASAHILSVSKSGNTNTYQVVNQHILDYIAIKERNTYSFLYCYFRKVMEDSGMWMFFESYINDGIAGALGREKYMALRDRFIRFLIGHTAINQAVEVRRIFPKILNIFAVENNIQGSQRGTLSKYAFTFSDLMYNRKNWRDADKDKAITRQEAHTDNVPTSQQAFSDYQVQKAVALLRRIQHDSEVHDAYAKGAATQAHHIFPKSRFPEIAHYLENLILLTATQHNTQAHPNNDTQAVDRDYQLTCLLAKSATIENSLDREGEKYYRKESFIHVVNTGLSLGWASTLTFPQLRQQLIAEYNKG